MPTRKNVCIMVMHNTTFRVSLSRSDFFLATGHSKPSPTRLGGQSYISRHG